MLFGREALLLLSALASATSAAQVQKPGLKLPASAAANANEIKSMFTEAYSTYRCVLNLSGCKIKADACHALFPTRFRVCRVSRKIAFGHDDLQPVSMTFNDGRNGWGASIVDAMSTMVIMGLDVRMTLAITPLFSFIRLLFL